MRTDSTPDSTTTRRTRRRAGFVTLAAALLAFPCATQGQGGALLDPGRGPWQFVDEDDIGEVCRLDYGLLEDAMIPATSSFAIVRYGRVCFVSGPDASVGTGVTHLFSSTKTLTGLLVGDIMYQTRDLPDSNERGRGPFRETDRMDKWVDLTTLPPQADVNPDARVAHVLAMVGYGDDLSWGAKDHQYDGSGSREINYLLDAIDTVVRQDPRRFGADAVEAKDRLFQRLGFEHSRWEGQVVGTSWYGSLLDMGRLGLAILHGGVYGGERIADARYIYNMTHPAFEDGSHNYGYLTWMNGTRCTPRAIHRTYPHGLSEATESGFGTQEHDVGVWYAYGANGQYVIGHRGLDMLVIGKNWGNGNEDELWETVLPSVVAGDPRFRGDQEAFCAAYSAGSYAPDLVRWEGGL